MPLILTIFFLIWPLGSLPLILRGIYKKRLYAFVLLAIFMGLYSMYYVPFGDQYRYRLAFQSLQEWDTFQLLYFRDITYRLSYIYPLMIIAKTIGLLFEHIRFFLVVVVYLAIFNLYKDISLKNKNYFFEKNNLFFFGIIFLAVPYFAICSSFRFGSATVFFCCAVYYFATDRRKLGTAYFLLACLGHHFFIISFLIIFIGKYIIKLIKKVPLLVFILPMCVPLFDFIVRTSFPLWSIILPDVFVEERLQPYFDGIWKTGDVIIRSQLNIIVSYICNQIHILFSFVILWLIYSDIKKIRQHFPYPLYYLYGSIIILTVAYLTFFNYVTISHRIFMVWVLLVAIMLVVRYSYISKKTNTLFLIFFFIFFLSNFSLVFFSIKKARSIGHEKQFLYSNAYQAFTHSYSDDFVNNHFNADGTADSFGD